MSGEASVVGAYATIDEAEGAVARLIRGGFPLDQMSIATRDLSSQQEVRGFVVPGGVARDGARIGAWIGGLFGLLVGAAFVWVPGFGPLLVAGPLAAAILGAIEGDAIGAAGGGLLGGLAGLGVSRERIVTYEQRLRAGQNLLVATGSTDEIARARAILDPSPHLAVEPRRRSELPSLG
jgi:hypothetical protein